MNLTTVQHDYRFPRRPDGRQLGDHDRRTLDVSMLEMGADLDKTAAAARHGLLNTPLFAPVAHDSGAAKSPDQLQREDPLATQVWKFFTRTKQQLPHQERMENMTWRMMALEMRKQRTAAAASQQTRCEFLSCRNSFLFLLALPRLPRLFH